MTPKQFAKHASKFWANILNPQVKLNKNEQMALDLLGHHYECYIALFGTLTTPKVEEFRDSSLRVLTEKGEEYSTSKDKLYNFKHASTIAKQYKMKLTPVQAAFGFQLKHLVSIDDIINNRRKFDADVLFEKFGDAINYCILIDALQAEDKQKRLKNKK